MIELIKYFVEYAEEWKINIARSMCPYLYCKGKKVLNMYIESIGTKVPKGFMDMGWPLFISAAIDGVNLKDDGYRIEQMYDMIDICDSEEYVRFEYSDYSSPLSARIAALTWIMEEGKR